MKEVKGLKALVKFIVEQDKQCTVSIVEGVSKIRHGHFVVKNGKGIIHENYGLRQLVTYLQTQVVEEGDVVSYIGLNDGQQECCVFNVEVGDDIVIKSSVTLNTPTSVSVPIKPPAVTEDGVNESALAVPTVVPMVVDYEYAETLSRAELVEYAQLFNIKLSPNKKKTAMIKDLRERLAE